jgi:hypothetical protein
VRHAAPSDRAGAGQMMIDLPPHRRRFAHHVSLKVGAWRWRVHDDGQRGLQRMGEIARMGSRSSACFSLCASSAFSSSPSAAPRQGSGSVTRLFFPARIRQSRAARGAAAAARRNVCNARHHEQAQAEQRESS